MAIEKRRERRIKVSLPASIIYKNNPEILGRIENISRLGAYVEIDRKIPMGSDIDITFKIPIYTKDLSLTGEVKCKGNMFRFHLAREFNSKKYYGIGVFFTSFLKQVDRDKLSEYIDFLILREEREIRAGIKLWREKRGITRKNKQNKQIQIGKNDYQTEIFTLLRKILIRLEEISSLLQSQNKIK